MIEIMEGAIDKYQLVYVITKQPQQVNDEWYLELFFTSRNGVDLKGYVTIDKNGNISNRVYIHGIHSYDHILSKSARDKIKQYMSTIVKQLPIIN